MCDLIMISIIRPSILMYGIIRIQTLLKRVIPVSYVQVRLVSSFKVRLEAGHPFSKVQIKIFVSEIHRQRQLHKIHRSMHKSS